jgi:hypothetical protein
MFKSIVAVFAVLDGSAAVDLFILQKKELPIKLGFSFQITQTGR